MMSVQSTVTAAAAAASRAPSFGTLLFCSGTKPAWASSRRSLRDVLPPTAVPYHLTHGAFEITGFSDEVNSVCIGKLGFSKVENNV